MAVQIDELVSVRTTLAAKGMDSSVQKLDRRIEQLRAAQERARLQALRSPEPANTAAAPPSAETGQIDALMSMRNTLAARGNAEAVAKLDTRIATLRMKRAKPDLEAPDGAVLRITAKRPASTGARPAPR